MAIPHRLDQGKQPAVDEIDISDQITRSINDVATLEINMLEVRKQLFEDGRRKSEQETIRDLLVSDKLRHLDLRYRKASFEMDVDIVQMAFNGAPLPVTPQSNQSGVCLNYPHRSVWKMTARSLDR